MEGAPPFWLSGAESLLAQLGSSPEGLTTAEAAARLRRDGPNEVVQSRPWRPLVEFGRRLANPLIGVLIGAALVAGFTGDLASLIIILSMVGLSTVLDLVQDRRAAVTAEALRRSVALKSRTRRDGQLRTVAAHDLVRGDVVELAAGDLAPADGLVLESNCAQVNEALLTGEPYPVEKRVGAPTSPALAEARNAIFQGSSLVGGSAVVLIVETGSRSRFGAIAQSVRDRAAPTAFELSMRRLGAMVARLTIFLCLFVLLAHLALGRPPLQSFLFSLALAVGLTPELLPMIVTVSLARGAQRLAKARVLVKRLAAIEDLGQMDVLCTDKTGTLTEARISVVGHIGLDGEDDERVVELAAVNARFESGLRSPLDEALLAHLAERPLDAWRKLDERPFDFERRRVSVLAERAGERIEIVKGAPETLLALCGCAQARDGRIIAIDADLRRRLQALHDDRAAQGLRLLAIAWKPAAGQARIDADGDEGLVFAGFCVFQDPPKISATAAIARLAAAGVRVKVISGDAAPAVRHLMEALGLPVSDLLTGDEISGLTDAALAARVGQIDLYARVTPDQKTRIVRALRARGHTVGFLGDGINDAAAIRAADVGISVDGATDVAREAADMILLAPDLEVMAEGVTEGRRTYANVTKYIRMAVSSNFGNMLTMALASIALPFLPLTPVQVLINNLLYDLSGVGLPFDRVDPQDVARPHGWDLKALWRYMAVMGPLSSAFDLATFAFLLWGVRADVRDFQTGWFVESILSQILVVFIIRTSALAWRSRPDPALVRSALVCAGAALALCLGPWASWLGFRTPLAETFAVLAAIVGLYLLAAEVAKRWAAPSPRGPKGRSALGQVAPAVH